MLKEIIPKIKDKQIIIFGETHGTKEIPEMLTLFFIDIAKEFDFNIALEIPIEFQDKIGHFIEVGDINLLKDLSFFSKENCPDGRNSLEYIRLMQKIHEINLTRNKKIRVFCIDPLANNQDEKEKGIADKLLELSKEKRIFAIMGSVHASKNIVNIAGIKIIPSGYFIFNKIKEKMFNVLLIPQDGIVGEEEHIFYKGFNHIIPFLNTTSCSFLF